MCKVYNHTSPHILQSLYKNESMVGFEIHKVKAYLMAKEFGKENQLGRGQSKGHG